jgi:sulfide:quinone oxidoreductase
MGTVKSQKVVVVGGGAAGTSVAASLLRKRPSLQVTVVEPSDVHYYQPAFTLVGGGAYKLADTARSQAQTLPKNARWVRQGVSAIQEAERRVLLADGRHLEYDVLVVSPGVELHWEAIDGLLETLGKNGVCSNYDPSLALYTHQCVAEFTGGTALFTQPATPIKCAGAPQKIAYLAADAWHKKGINAQVNAEFYTGTGALFSVPDFVPHLQSVAQQYGIGVFTSHNLIKVDGEQKVATFTATDAEGNASTIEQSFDMLHVTPPQRAPKFVRDSALANEGGWLNVDKHSLQNPDYPEIFSLGDASSIPTSKTAAAVRKQAPVVVKNVLAHIDQKALKGHYDGYTSCPLVTAKGKVILAEFTYGGTVTPTLPLNPFKQSGFYWIVKKYLLPMFYWGYMLKGKEGDIAHKPLK